MCVVAGESKTSEVEAAETEDGSTPAEQSDTSQPTETKKLPVHSFFGHLLLKLHFISLSLLTEL